MGLAAVVQLRPHLTNIAGLIDSLVPPSRPSCRSVVLMHVSASGHLTSLVRRLDFAVVANAAVLKFLDPALAVLLGVAKMLGEVCSLLRTCRSPLCGN